MHKESDFEHSIEQSLLQHGGYQKGDPLAYDSRESGGSGRPDRTGITCNCVELPFISNCIMPFPCELFPDRRIPTTLHFLCHVRWSY